MSSPGPGSSQQHVEEAEEGFSVDPDACALGLS